MFTGTRKIRLVMPKSPYTSLVDYMERTATTSARLREQANALLRGSGKMSKSLFSMILRGSRRCSVEKAWALHQVTGVPMEELTRWPRNGKSIHARNSRSAA